MSSEASAGSFNIEMATWEEALPYYDAAICGEGQKEIGDADNYEPRAYYLAHFQQAHERKGALKLSWSWSGFLFSVSWYAYRKMYLVYIALLLATLMTALLDFQWVWMLLSGVLGKDIYYQIVKQRIRKVQALPREQALEALRQKGGTSLAAFVILTFVVIAAHVFLLVLK